MQPWTTTQEARSLSSFGLVLNHKHNVCVHLYFKSEVATAEIPVIAISLTSSYVLLHATEHMSMLPPLIPN